MQKEYLSLKVRFTLKYSKLPYIYIQIVYTIIFFFRYVKIDLCIIYFGRS